LTEGGADVNGRIKETPPSWKTGSDLIVYNLTPSRGRN